MKLSLGQFYLYATVFVVGVVILVLEVLGTRIIAPYYGATIYVWSSLIAVTLVALVNVLLFEFESVSSISFGKVGALVSGRWKDE